MKRKIFSAVIALIMCIAMLPWNALAEQMQETEIGGLLPPDEVPVVQAEAEEQQEEAEDWISKKLRALEQQYESGIMPLSFVVGNIPWEQYFTVAGLPNTISKEAWLAACMEVSQGGYNVDNTGVQYTKFPQYDGIHFVNVTINGVEVVRAGILMPDTGEGEPVYYYMTQKHVDSDKNDGSGSHTGSISALILPEGAKFQVNYAVNEYKLAYEIELGGSLVNALPVDPDNEQSATWEQAIFAGQNPASTTHGAASFPVNIPYGYTATVWMRQEGIAGETQLTGDRTDIVDETARAAKVVNEGYALGTEPEYETYDLEDGGKGIRLKAGFPSAKRMSAVFYSDLVQQNCTIIVRLVKDGEDQKPVFDAHLWLETTNANGRGSTAANIPIRENDEEDGKIIGYKPNLNRAQNDGNVQEEDGWGWNLSGSAFNQDPRDNSQETKYNTHWYQEEDGTWTLLWAFQTNAPERDFILNALELNGEFIDIPFRPQHVWNGGDVPNSDTSGTSVTTTTLSNGAKVELTFHRQFGSTQRVYILEITGARSNITVTGGNIMMYGDGAPEYVATVMSGVTADDKETDTFGYFGMDGDWHTVPKATVQVQQAPAGNKPDNRTNFAGDTDHHGANLRFRLQVGYENPVFQWENRVSGVDLEGSALEGKGLGVISLPEESEQSYWDYIEQNADQYLNNDNLKPNAIYGPVLEDGQEWYYLRIETVPGGSNKMCVLSLTATAMRYMVRYMVGTPDADTNGPSDAQVKAETMPYFSKDNSSWDDGLTGQGGIEGNYPERYDDNNGSFYDRQVAPTIPISHMTPETKDGKKFFLYWVLVDRNEKPISDADGYPIIVRPNETIDLSKFAKYGVDLDSDIGATDYNYYVLRLKGVWSDVPMDFQFYIRMVWTDEETGKSHVMDLVQNVITSSTDGNMTEDGCLIVTVNTVTDIFKNWFKLHPFYAYAARDFIPTADRPKDQFTDADNKIWEQYPEDYTEGSTEQGVKNPNAHYRVEVDENDVVRYIVQREGTIVLYLDPVNGRLPVTKQVVGSEAGADPFKYTVTVHLLPEDIARNQSSGDDYLTVESLKNMLPKGTYFGMAPEAEMTELQAFAGKDVELHFARYTEGEDMTQWYSRATFELKGGEATVLSIPQGEYTIEEEKGNSAFLYDVTVNGQPSAERIGIQKVEAKNVAAAVNFENKVQPVDSPLKVTTTIEGQDAKDVTFDYTLALVKGDAAQVSYNGAGTPIVASGGQGEGNPFGELTFSHTGTYEFLVTETARENNGTITPASAARSVIVEVENVNGQLVITKITVDGTVYQGETGEFALAQAVVPFAHKYIPLQEGMARVFPEVKKVLHGRSLLPAAFTFEFTHEGKAYTATNSAAANDEAGVVSFDPIDFDKAGEYTIEVREQNDGKAGILYDDQTVVTITYTVDVVDGQLKVTKTEYQDGVDTFENQVYADAEFSVRKRYELSKRPGGGWEGETFTVTATLIEAAGKVEQKGASALAVGDVAQLELTESAQTGELAFRFYREGSYVFEVRETDDNLPGVSYDNSVYYVTVTVSADGDALASAVSIAKRDEPIEGTTLTFDNKFDPKSINVTVSAQKVLNGGNLTAGRFRFQLVEQREDDIEGLTWIAGNDANGNVVFTVEGLTEGSYTYLLSEINDGEQGISYDEKEYTVVVDVVPGEDGVTYTVKYDGKEQAPTFVNTFTALGQLVVSNTVSGSGADPEKEFTYTFTFGEEETDFRYELTSEESAATSMLRLLSRLIMPLFAPNSVALNGTIRSGQSIQLRSGQTVTIYGLPEGTAYTVTESDYADYTVEANGEQKDRAEGEISGNQITRIDFENRRVTGSLTVSNAVSGTDSEPNREFHFWVELSDKSVNGQYGDMQFVDGVAEFTLKGGQSKTATGLLSGISYTVTQTDANADGYTTASTGETVGFVQADETVVVSFTNHRDELPIPPTDEPQQPEQPEQPELPELPELPEQPEQPSEQPPVDDVPKTGDTSDPALWWMLMGFSAIALALLLRKRNIG